MTDVAGKKVCRFCLEQDVNQLGDLFAKSDGKVPLVVQVMSCVSIEIFEGDEMPTYCCHVCRKLLDVMYQYKQICRKSDVVLKQCMITGKLPGKFALPMDLIKECLPKEMTPEKVYRDASVEVKVKCDTKAVQTEREVTDVPKEIIIEGPPPKISSTIVLEEVRIEPPPKRLRTCVRIEDNQEDDQIEILELTQSEVDNLQPDEKKYAQLDTPKITNETKPILLNKSHDQQKMTKPVIEFQKFVMNDNGDFEVEILEGVAETGDNSVFSCDFCPRTFMIKQQLELHLETHFKERNFCCEVCDNKFMSKNDLVKHLQTHSGERAHV